MVSVGSASSRFIGIFLIFHLFLNTVPSPAVNHPCILQPLSSTIHKSPKCVVEGEPLNPWCIPMAVYQPRCQGTIHAEWWIAQEHRPRVTPGTHSAGRLPLPSPNTNTTAAGPSWRPCHPLTPFQLVALQPEHCCCTGAAGSPSVTLLILILYKEERKHKENTM